MTEQPPSFEAKALAYDTIGFCLGPFLHDNITPRAKDELRDIIADALDRFAAQRVAAETERLQNRDRHRLEQINRLQETVQSFQSARDERPAPEAEIARLNKILDAHEKMMHPWYGPCDGFGPEEQCAECLRVLGRDPFAERPAPEGPQQGGYVIEVEFDDGDEAQRAYDAIERLLGEIGQIGTLGMRPLPSVLSSTGEQPASPAAVVELGEQSVERAAKAGYLANYKVYGVPKDRIVAWEEAEPDKRQNWRFLFGQMVAALGWRPAVDVISPPSPAAVVDYTERAREEELQELWLDLAEKDDRTSPEEYPDMALLTREEFFGYLKHYASAVAAEHQAAAIRAFGKRVWSDTEEVAYQAGVSDARAKLREPDVRDALRDTLRDAVFGARREYTLADAALTKIAEMLK